jgi:hypothetical protein
MNTFHEWLEANEAKRRKEHIQAKAEGGAYHGLDAYTALAEAAYIHQVYHIHEGGYDDCVRGR